MKINAISITNSILKGVTLPEKPKDCKYSTDCLEGGCDCQKRYTEAYNSALQQGIEFEDQEKIKTLYISKGFYPAGAGIYPLVEPIECEVQRQWSKDDFKTIITDESELMQSYQYKVRTVLVICEVKEETKIISSKITHVTFDKSRFKVKEQPVKPEQEMKEEIFTKFAIPEKLMGEVSKPEKEELTLDKYLSLIGTDEYNAAAMNIWLCLKTNGFTISRKQ